MSDFKEFWEAQNRKEKKVLGEKVVKDLKSEGLSPLIGNAAVQQVEAKLLAVPINGMEDRKKRTFAKKLVAYVQTDDFIEKLSSEIGTPGDQETEEEFVKRSKARLAKLLEEEFL